MSFDKVRLIRVYKNSYTDDGDDNATVERYTILDFNSGDNIPNTLYGNPYAKNTINVSGATMWSVTDKSADTSYEIESLLIY